MNTTNLFQHCINGFQQRIILTDGQLNFLAGFIILLIPVVIATNVCLAWSLYKTKLLNSRSRWYIFLLCLSDLAVGLVTLPLYLVLFTKLRRRLNCWFEYATAFVSQWTFNTSLYLIALISFHRWLKISPELRNRSYKGFKQSVMSGAIADFLVVLCFVLPVFDGLIGSAVFGYYQNTPLILAIKLKGLFLFLVIYVLYYKLYNKVTKRARGTTLRGGKKVDTKSWYEKQLIKTIILVLGIMAIAFFPHVIMDTWTTCYTHFKKTVSPQWVRFGFYVSTIFVYVMCIADALIFIYRSKKIKRYIADQWCGLLKCRQNSNV